MIEKTSVKMGQEEEVLYRRHRNEGNLMVTDYRSALLEKFFASMVEKQGERVVGAGGLWPKLGGGDHQCYALPFYPEVAGAKFSSDSPILFDRESDTFNLFPLTFVGLGEGISILTEDLIYEAERKGLYRRFNQVINDFYNKYLRPIEVEVTLSVRVEKRAA